MKEKGFLQRVFDKNSSIVEALGETQIKLAEEFGYLGIAPAFGLALAELPFRAIRRTAETAGKVVGKPLDTWEWK